MSGTFRPEKYTKNTNTPNPIHIHEGTANGGLAASVFVIPGILNENVKYCRKAVCTQTMPKNGKIRVAAIGVGSLGRHHARNYADLAVEGRVDFVGICDIDAETGTRVSREHGSASIRNWRDLIGKVDAGPIAHPTETPCAFT